MDGSISIRGSVFEPTRWIKEGREDVYHASSERQMALVRLLERWMLGCRGVVRLIRASVKMSWLAGGTKTREGQHKPEDRQKNIKTKGRAPLRMIQGVQTKPTDAKWRKARCDKRDDKQQRVFPPYSWTRTKIRKERR